MVKLKLLSREEEQRYARRREQYERAISLLNYREEKSRDVREKGRIQHTRRHLEAQYDRLIANFVEHNVGLIYRCAGEFYAKNPNIDFDKLLSKAGELVLRCAIKYDYRRNAKFSSYFYRATHNAFSRLAALEGRNVARASGDELRRLECMTSAKDEGYEDPFDRTLVVELVRKAVWDLSGRSRIAVESRFELNGFRGNGLLFKEIGAELGITGEGARHVFNKSLEELAKNPAMIGAAEAAGLL